jgi:hypothetical protein
MKTFLLSGPVTAGAPATAEPAAVVEAGATVLAALEATGAFVAAAAEPAAAVVGAALAAVVGAAAEAAAGALVGAVVAAVVAVGLLLPPQAARAAVPATALAIARKWRRFIPAPRRLRSNRASVSGSWRTCFWSQLSRDSIVTPYSLPYAAFSSGRRKAPNVNDAT